jgi:hypothetical protein
MSEPYMGTEEFVLEADQPKKEIPEAVKNTFQSIFDDIVAKRKALFGKEMEMMQAQEEVRNAQGTFKEFLDTVRQRLDVPRGWDLTPDADYFFEPTIDQKFHILPIEMRVDEVVRGGEGPQVVPASQPSTHTIASGDVTAERLVLSEAECQGERIETTAFPQDTLAKQQ